MRTAKNELLQNFSGLDVKDIYLTPNGRKLAETDQSSIEAFLDTAHQLTAQPPVPRGTFEYIDGGRFSHVYGLPGHPDKCLKVVTPKTMKDSWKSDFHTPVLPNLINEARFMDLVGRRLSKKPENKVLAPTQYAAARFAGGLALLQQRIPEEFVGIHRLKMDQPGRVAELFKDEQAEIAFSKVRRALGHSALRLGIGDMRGEGGRINRGNFLVDKEKLAEEGDVYVIDLVGRLKIRRAFAAVMPAISL